MPSISDVINALWKSNFFLRERTFNEIAAALSEKGINPTPSALRTALKRAKFLTRKRRLDTFYYIQKFPAESGNTLFKTRKRRNELQNLQMHKRIVSVSGDLFSDGHYSSAIFEAFKEINNMVKEKTGMPHLDGKDLMAKAFNLNQPKLRWSKLITESEKNEQEGFMLIFMGIMVGIRNPKAHDRIIQRDKIKAIEYLALASLLARKIDEAEKVG